MAQQPPSPFRRFLRTPVGRLVLVLLAVAVVFATYAYVSVIIAIPAILLFGLALPIWVGLKRPRFLAVVGLAIILTVGPLANIVFTQDILTPVGSAESATGAPFENSTAGDEADMPTGVRSSWVKTTFATGATVRMIASPASARYRGRFSPTQMGTTSPNTRIAGMAMMNET